MKRTPARAWPVTLHIAAMALSIALPVLAVAGGAVWRLSSAEQQEVQERVRQSAREFAIDVDRELTAFTSTLEVLATSPRLKSGGLGEFERQAREVVRRYDWHLVLADATGQQLINTLAPSGAALPKLRETFGSGIARATKRPYVSDLFEGRVAQRPIVTVYYPVIEAEEVRYVLVLGMMPIHFAPLFERTGLQDRWTAAIIDRRGTVIASSDPVWGPSGRALPLAIFNVLSSAPRGTSRIALGSGSDTQTAWARSGISDWIVAVSVPVSVLNAPAAKAWLGFGIGSAVLLLLAGSMAFSFGREIARPIRALKRLAAPGGQGAFRRTRLSEANDVADAFAQARRRLSDSELRYRTLAERARDIVLLLDNRGVILEANAAAADAYGYATESLVGTPVSVLRDPSTLASVHDELARAASVGLLFESVHRRKDGTSFPVEVSAAPAEIGGQRLIFSIVRDITSRKRAEAELRDREAILQTVTQNIGVGLVLLDAERRFTFINRAYTELVRRSDAGVRGRGVAEVMGAAYEAVRPELDRAYAGEEVSFELDQSDCRPEGREDRAILQITYQPIRDRAGEVAGVIAVLVDVTAAKRDAAHIRFLMRELSHRSKNLLAVILAMTRQTARTSESLADFEARFSARIMGLARSHDLLTQQDWQGVPVADLVRSQLAPFADPQDPRIQLSGPALVLGPEAANHLGLALHELATNAVKFGALSTPGGRIVVRWSANGLFRIVWAEEGVPAAQPPSRSGFGRQVIESIVAAALNGKAGMEFRPGGIVWTLEAPLAGVVLGAAATGVTAPLGPEPQAATLPLPAPARATP